MITRCLESRDLLRASVRSAEVHATEPAAVVLKTAAVVAARKAISSADAAMLQRQHLAAVGDTVEGRLRIDFLTDDIVRIRYAQGPDVPANPTPMVVGSFPAPAVTITRDAPTNTLRARTAAIELTVHLDPFRIAIHDHAGRKLTGIGGPEKDNFCAWDTHNTGIARATADGSPVATENFDLHHDEAVYGLGERFLRLNKVGQTVDLTMQDALGVTSPRAYKNIPFYMTTAGYGVFFNHSSLLTLWVGSASTVDVQVAIHDDFLDYYLFFGDLKHILHQYTALTGRGTLPPKWTFGYWQSKISYQSADETLAIAKAMRQHDIPCDVIHLDTHWFKKDWYCDLQFDPVRFPDPAAYFRQLAGMGVKVSLWQLPYIPEGSQLFEDLKAVDGFVKTRDGGIYNVRICFVAGFKGIVGLIDYTNPAAVAVHQRYLRALLQMGAAVFKTDFGEAAPLDGVYYDGTPGHRMHNLYPLLYNQAVAAVTREVTGENVVWARSAWAGSQRFPLHWGGDNSPNYFNMAPQIEGGLSFGLSGFQFWSQDIGGFCGTVNEPLLIRWMQTSMFLSHARIHGSGDRELYKFAPETIRICRDFIRLRYRLMPYIYGSARACVEQSLPMLRALVLEFPDDPTTHNIGDQFLFGDSLMLAPLYTPADTRRVYLPAGAWTHWFTRQTLQGPAWITARESAETIPLYIREGGLIPIGPAMNYVNEIPTDPLTLLLAPLQHDGTRHCTAAVDDRWVPFTYTRTAGRHELTIGPGAPRVEIQTLGSADLHVRRL